MTIDMSAISFDRESITRYIQTLNGPLRYFALAYVNQVTDDQLAELGQRAANVAAAWQNGDREEARALLGEYVPAPLIDMALQILANDRNE